MTTPLLIIGIVLISLGLLPLVIIWLCARRAPTITWYCHRCDQVWGYYPGGKLFQMAGDNQQRLETPHKLCFRCQAIMHENMLAASPLAKEVICGSSNTHPSPTPADAAKRGILPEVDRIF